jgi:hypothetical protein
MLRGVLLFLIFISSYTNAAYLVKKIGKSCNIIVIDTAAMYNPNTNSFKIGVLKGNYDLQKCNIKFLIINQDTLYFSGTFVHVVHAAGITDSLPGVSISDSSHKYGANSGTGSAHDTLSEVLAYSRSLARKGTAMAWTGFGLNYGVAIPVGFFSTFNIIYSIINHTNDQAGVFGFYISLIANRVAKGLMITGASYCGTGASITYENCRQQNINLKRNINWGFFRAGIITEGLSNALLLSGPFMLSKARSDFPEILVYGGIIGLGTISNALFIASTCNASHYIRKQDESNLKKRVDLHIYPSVSFSNESAGFIIDISL